MQFNQAHNLIKKLIKRRLLFHLVLIINCNIKITHKRSSVINSIYSVQQQFSYIIKNTITYFNPKSFITLGLDKKVYWTFRGEKEKKA